MKLQKNESSLNRTLSNMNLEEINRLNEKKQTYMKLEK